MHARSPRIAVALTLAAAITTGAAAPGSGSARWSEDLAAADPSGVLVAPDGVRLDPTAPGANSTQQLGLLTLSPHEVATGTDRVLADVDADVPAGTVATVDVRGRRADGEWTEWVPADATGEVELPEPTREVQGRLVLAGTPANGPVVRAIDLTATPAKRPRIALADRPMLGYRVFATREGLVGGTTANGHVIAEDDLFVALPSRRALAARDTGEYSVRVCTATRCAYAPVWDVGPWNTRDDYWNPPDVREDWRELPQGIPQAQVAHLEGFNGGRDQFDREVLNPAGVDLSDAVFLDALKMPDNGWVQVDYLWTGSAPLGTVREGPLDVRAAADDDAAVVGTAAPTARLPVDCRDGDWLRIGDRQYVAADAVSLKRQAPACGPVAAAADTVERAREKVDDAVGRAG